MTDHRKPSPGRKVNLRTLPPGFLDGLSQDVQNVILEVVGKCILLTQDGEDGRAELAFKDAAGDLHIIHVDPRYIE